MGGVTVLLAGDFRKPIPIVSRGTRANKVKAYKSHLSYGPYEILTLKIKMRVQV